MIYLFSENYNKLLNALLQNIKSLLPNYLRKQTFYYSGRMSDCGIKS